MWQNFYRLEVLAAEGICTSWSAVAETRVALRVVRELSFEHVRSAMHAPIVACPCHRHKPAQRLRPVASVSDPMVPLTAASSAEKAKSLARY